MMKRAAATVLLATWAHADWLGAREPSRLILPEQRLPLSFSHKQHLALNVKCDFCHAKAAQSRVARDFLIPPEETCTDCHAVERDQPNKQAKPVAACSGCHPGFSGAGQPARIDIPAPFVKFNHQVHVVRGVECTHCHAGVVQADLATRNELPRMPLCLGCHDGRQAPSRCTTCHFGDAEGRIKTNLPGGTLTPSGVLRGDAHDLRFRRDHRRVAVNDPAYCENCHRPEFCLGCHNGVTKPLDFHANDYLSIHAADARRNVPDCSSCHRLQTFCLGCHERSGMTLGRDVATLRGPPASDYNSYFTSSSTRATGGASHTFHPAGWLTLPRLATHHSFQAQRNMAACISCHREETCLACHANSAVRVGDLSPGLFKSTSPHPADWTGSSRCRTLADKNPRVCLKCHAVDSPERECR